MPATLARGSQRSRAAAGDPAEFWDYSDGGASWQMGRCAASSGQSPVNLSMVVPVQGGADVLFQSYSVAQTPVTMLNNGRVLAVQLAGGLGGISLGSDTWDIWQIVIHGPSEHTFMGQHAALEVQLYHHRTGLGSSGEVPAANDTAVVALGFVPSVESSPFLDSLRQGGLPNQPGEQRTVNGQAPAALDFGALFQSTFFQYTGSLTTPPCSSGVQWFVASEVLPASVAALNDFGNAIAAVSSLQQVKPGNARNLQRADGLSVVVRNTQAIARPTLLPGASADPDFEKAVVEAVGEQESFEASIPENGQEVTKDTVISACFKDLLQSKQALTTVEAQMKVECKSLEEAKKRLKETGIGVTRLQAELQVQTKKRLCVSCEQVVARLQNEVRIMRVKCNALKTARAGADPR